VPGCFSAVMRQTLPVPVRRRVLALLQILGNSPDLPIG
jgi:hypothetical protein